ncbi:IgGFc-binding protein-like [Diadema setosum]|uniref:IgGFc-binding protein-like n=1 Tax=Diadema setosum TaxID=31175 RepID=UPI003B3B3AC5
MAFSNKQPDTRGREFIFAMPSNFNVPSKIQLMIGSSNPGLARVMVNVPGYKFRREITLNVRQMKTLSLPGTVAANGGGPQNGTIVITSNLEVTVHAASVMPKTNDGFVAIPTDAIGKEYIIASYDIVTGQWSSFTITGTKQGTRIRVVPSQRVLHNRQWYNAGQIINVNLNAAQTMQIRCPKDLTGTYIMADKPVSVVSGATCTRVPSSMQRCDHLVEMLPPVSALGTRFSLLPLLNRTGYVFRMIAARPNTKVHLAGTIYTLGQRGSFREFNQDAQLPVSLTSNKPLLVTQYGKGMDPNFWGDPFMTIIPPVEQYMQGMTTFGTLAQSGQDMFFSFMSISTTSADLFSISLNNILVMGTDLELPKAAETLRFTADRTMKIENIPHTLHNPSFMSRFTAIVHGVSQGSGYGYPIGYNLRTLLCSRTDPMTGLIEEFQCPAPIPPIQPGLIPSNVPGMPGNIPIQPGVGLNPGFGGFNGMFPGMATGGQPGAFLPGNFFTGGKPISPNIPILPGQPIDPNAGAAQTQPGQFPANNPLNPISPNNPFANPGQPFVPMVPFNPIGPGMIPPPENCFTLGLLILAAVAPVTVVFIVMLVILLAIVYRFKKKH